MHFNFFQYYTAEFCEKMDLRMGKRPKNFGVSGYFGSKNFGVSGYLYEINFGVSGFVCIYMSDFQTCIPKSYRTHKSLDAFCEKFSSRIGERILLYTKDYQKDGATSCLPVYFTPFL